MLKSRNEKKGIKVIPPWQVGDTDNFLGFDTDTGTDTDIEPAVADDWDSDDNKDGQDTDN
jgi:hypothetical protein